jgi:hypothetical protein
MIPIITNLTSSQQGLQTEEKENDSIHQLKNLGFKWPDAVEAKKDLFLTQAVLPAGWQKGPEMYAGINFDQTKFYIADQTGKPRVLITGKDSWYDSYSFIEVLTEERQQEISNNWSHQQKILKEKPLQYEAACNVLMKARVNKWDTSHTWCVLMICIPKNDRLRILYGCGGYYSTQKEAVQAATLLKPNGFEDLYVRLGQIIENPSKYGPLSEYGSLSEFKLVGLSSDWSHATEYLNCYTLEKREEPSFPAVMLKESIQRIIPRGIQGLDEI